VVMIRLVFSNPWFVAAAICIFAVMMLGLLIISEYLFLQPYVVGHIPSGTEFGFVLILVIAVLSALVIPANIFRMAVLNRPGQKIGGGIAGSTIGVVAGACSCGTFGVALISIFGSAGAAATSFFTAYEMPLRLLAVAILVLTYVTTARSLKAECSIRV